MIFCRKYRVFRALISAASLLVCAGSGSAATDTDTFNVTATVIAACAMTAGDHDFGNYEAVSGSPLDSTSTISVTCTSGSAYSIALNAGTTVGGTIATRLMTDSVNTLEYNLYTNGTYATIWGDGTSGSVEVSGTGSGSLQQLTVFGRMPGSQAAPVGSYSDVITATITY
jgi:spore coat protein U-like protein